jgi:hypothetical protein
MMANEIEVVPTPFGDGVISEVGGNVSLTFGGPMAREALEFALSASEADRRAMTSALDAMGA